MCIRDRVVLLSPDLLQLVVLCLYLVLLGFHHLALGTLIGGILADEPQTAAFKFCIFLPPIFYYLHLDFKPGGKATWKPGRFLFRTISGKSPANQQKAKPKPNRRLRAVSFNLLYARCIRLYVTFA